MKYKINSKLFAVIISCAIVLAGLYLSALNAYAATNTDGNWTTGQTIDLIPDLTSAPLLNQGWGLWDANQVDANGWLSDDYGYVIRAQDSSDDLGTDSYTGGVYYTIELSEADKVKANLGQLTLGASSVNYFQASSTHYISIRVYFYDSNGEAIGSGVTKTYTNYYVAQKDVTLTLTDAAVPAGTCSMQVWFSNWGSNAGRPFIANPTCYLYDTTAPSFSGATLEKTSVADGANNRVVTGDTFKYCIGFNEKVSITSGGTAAVTLNGSAYLTSSDAQVVTENGKSRVCYTFTLSEGSQSGTIALSSVSGLTVADEAGNSYTYSGSPSADTLQYYKTMSVSSAISHLSFSGGSTAKYYTDYTASLVAAAGYSLPSSIKVTVGGATLTQGTDYMYDSSTGALTVNGSVITGNMVVTASGVANSYVVSLDMQGGSMGSASVTATYDSAMPSITLPVRSGYTFGGYFSQTGGNGTQYYGADGSSLRSFDQTSGITLYAHWTANTYTVVYNSNKPSGASGTVTGNTASSSHTYDTQKNLTTNGFTLTGWTFQGWATSPNGNVVYENGSQVKNLTAESGGTVNLYAVWEQTSHQITFNACGGSGSGTVSVLFDGELPSLVTEPSRKGYHFKGYYTQENGNGVMYYGDDFNAVQGLTYTAEGNLTLYAYWVPIRYDIELYSQGQYVGVIKNVVYGELLLPSAQDLGISRPNYDFVGWNLYEEQNWSMYNADVSYNVGIADFEGEKISVYAAWLEKDIYTINFDANGGFGAPAMAQAHETETVILSATIPSRDDYTFVGWATVPDAYDAEYFPGGEFTMGDSVVTLFAVWRRNPSLSYSANGGEFINNVTLVYPAAGSSVTITEIKPVRTGYEFVGWATTDNAVTAQYVSGGTFTMPSVNTVLYAVWERQEFTVSRNIASGYAISGLSDRYCYGDNLEFTVSGENPKVYINGTPVVCDGEGRYSFTVTDNISVSVADSSSLVLIYSANGGSGAPTDGSIYSIGSAATLSNIVPVRTGYTFCGWSVIQDAQSAEYGAGDSLTFTNTDVILYAIWRANAYTVTYNAAGGEGAMQNSSYSYGTSGALSGNVFVKEGFTFIGWALSDGGECVFADGDEVLNLSAENGANVTLYAVWKQIKTLITLESDGGTGGSANLSVGYGEMLSVIGLTAPVRSGYTFGGYFTERDGNGELFFDGDMLPINYTVNGWDRTEQNLTLYAYWIPTPETIMNDVRAAIDEVQTNLDNAVAELQAAINANETDIEAKVSALDSAYKAADAILRSDFTAADAELEAKITALENAMNAADSALQAAINTVQTNLDNAVAELQAAINANETDIEAKVSALDSAYKAADTLLRSDFTAADAELEAKITALENAMNAADSALQAAINTVQTNLDNAVAELQAAINANETDIEAKVSALDSAYKTADALLRTDMTEADEELKAKITALENAMNAADSALQAAINAVQSNLDRAVAELQAAIDANETDIEAKVLALDSAYQAADAILRSDFTAADEELEAKITALENAMNAADSALQTAIDTVQSNLDNAVAQLQNAINTNETDIENKVSALDIAYKAADTLLRTDMATADEELNGKITALETAMNQADSALQTAIETVQSNLDNAVAQLQNAINTNEADIENKVSALDTAYKAADTLIRSDMATADEELNGKITALETAMKAADLALQTAINTVQSNLDNAVADLQAAINDNEADIEAKVSALDSAYKAADTLLRTDMATADEKLKSKITALETAMKAADLALQTAINTVQSNLDNAVADLQAAINDNEADIEAKVSALDSAYKAADALLRTDMATADEELNGKITALETAMRAADSALQAAIDTVQSNLDNAVAQLQDAINTNEADIEAKVSALDSAYQAADAILRSDFTAADAELEAKITALEYAMNAADSALRAGIQELQQRLNEIKTELDIRDDELESKLNSVIAENEKIELTYRIIIIIISAIEAIIVVLFVFYSIKKKKTK